MPEQLFPPEDEPKPVNEWPDEQKAPEEPIFYVPYVPETVDETARRSGLAWSAGIAFFGSVAFCLFLGWIADLLLGSSPWGLVGGIVLGSIIGFLQFFRMSRQIFTSKNEGPAVRPLMESKDDDEPPGQTGLGL